MSDYLLAQILANQITLAEAIKNLAEGTGRADKAIRDSMAWCDVLKKETREVLRAVLVAKMESA